MFKTSGLRGVHKNKFCVHRKFTEVKKYFFQAMFVLFFFYLKKLIKT